jgi:CHAD domain-containing protein
MKLRIQFADAAASLARELQRQFRLMLDTERPAAVGEAVALHDLRVAMRRLRALLSALEDPLARTDAAALERRWQHFSRALNPMRDADVWRGLLRELPGVTPAFQRRVMALLRRKRPHPAQLLGSYTWARLKRDTQILLDTALPAALAKPGRDARPTPALRRCWKKITARAAARAADRHLAQMDRAHKVRIACRRARYLADFLAATVTGRKERRAWAQAARRYRAAQDALGQTHDADVLLEFLHAAKLRPPAALTAELQARRTAGLANFSKAWKKIAG